MMFKDSNTLYAFVVKVIKASSINRQYKAYSNLWVFTWQQTVKCQSQSKGIYKHLRVLLADFYRLFINFARGEIYSVENIIRRFDLNSSQPLKYNFRVYVVIYYTSDFQQVDWKYKRAWAKPRFFFK